MKKVFNEVFIVVIFLFLFSMDALMFSSDKIEYRGINIAKSMSAIEVEDAYVKLDGVVVRCNLDYPSYEYNIDFSKKVDVNQVRKEINEGGKKYHTEKNEAIFKTIGEIDAEYSYISSYSPFIEYGFDKNDFSERSSSVLNKLASNKYIKKIEVLESDCVVEDMLAGAAGLTGAWDDFYNGTVTGAGVKVGLLETGIIDIEHENIEGSNYTIRPYLLNSVSDHATQMASLIAGNYGLANDAHIYNAKVAGTLNNELDWLVDKNVDLVNMSFGTGYTGVYNNDSAIIDYYAKAYCLLFIASAGNDAEEGLVGNPGLGYNVLTVGAVNEDNMIAGFSSHNVISGPEKPTLLMYGSGVSVPNYDPMYSGTSYSAALTTGTIAMLFEVYPILKLTPERTIALAAANTYRHSYYEGDMDNGLNDLQGAGILRYSLMKANFNDSDYFLNPINAGERVRYTMTVYANVHDIIKVCLVWFADTNGTASSTTFNDYDIKIYSSNDLLVAYDGSLDDNLELMEYHVAYTGLHTIQVYQYDATTEAHDMAIAVQVIDQ